MTLLAYALTTVESAKMAIGITDDDIQIPVISIYNSSSDATAATYQILSAGIRL